MDYLHWVPELDTGIAEIDTLLIHFQSWAILGGVHVET